MKTLLPVAVIILVLLFSPPKLTPAYGATTYVIENKSNLPLKHRNDFKLLKKMAKFEHLTKRLNESTDKFEIVWLTAWILCLLISISFYVAAARTVDLLTLIFVNPAYWAIGTTFAILSGIFFIIWLLKVSANLEKAGKLKPL